jgi:tetratricopeptide (TPR) repeat protein
VNHRFRAERCAIAMIHTGRVITPNALLAILLVAFPVLAQERPQPESPNSSWAVLHGRGYTAFASGRYADALTDFKASLPLAAGPEQRAMTLSDFGYTLAELGRAAEALEQLEQALALWRGVDPAGHPALQVATTVGILQRTLGNFRESEQTLRAVADSARRDSSDRALALVALGDLMNEQDRFIEARPVFEAALKLSPERDRTRAAALIGLGDAQSNGGQFQPGIVQLREALAISREINVSELEALALRDLGNTYAEMGDFASAQTMLRRALPIFEAAPGMRIQYAGTLVSLGVIYGAEDKLGLAEDGFARALKVYGDASANPRSALALQNLAMIRAQQKRFAEAEDLARRAHSALKSAFGETSAPAAHALGTLARVEEKAGNLEQSEHDYSRALAILRDDGVLGSASVSGILSGYVTVLRKLHRRHEARVVEQQLKAFRNTGDSQ